MTQSFWGEYARVKRLVELSKVPDGLLDALLDQYADAGHMFDLHDCRRRLKNRGRNLDRTDRIRSALLRHHATRLGPLPVEPPPVSAVRREQAATIRRVAGGDWTLLQATVDGDYAAVAATTGSPTGTIKARVSRVRAKLRPLLARLA